MLINRGQDQKILLCSQLKLNNQYQPHLVHHIILNQAARSIPAPTTTSPLISNHILSLATEVLVILAMGLPTSRPVSTVRMVAICLLMVVKVVTVILVGLMHH